MLLKCGSQNLGAKIFTYDRQFGEVLFHFLLFPPSRHGDGCAQLDRMDVQKKKKLRAHVACSMKKAKSPKMASYGPSNFESDKLHLKLLKITQFLGVAHFSFT